MIGTVLNRIKAMYQDPIFLKKAFAISIPITAQALLNTVINLVDTLMIGQLGETTIAAVGLANKVFFVFTLLLFGVASGAGILAAQYWGKREEKNIKRVLGFSLILGIIAALIFLIPSVLSAGSVMRIFTPNKDTIRVGAAYLSIVAIGYPLTAITNIYVAMLRSINQVLIPVFISCIAIFVNIFLNYALIFGHFGFPALGVEGAAIATVIARLVECVSMVGIIYLSKKPIAASFKEMFQFDLPFVKKFISTAHMVILNEFMWGLGITMYSLVYGRMGNEAVASITITQTVEEILMVVFQGISAATAVILGNELGAGHLKKADEYAKHFIVLQFILSILMMLFCIFTRNGLLNFFNFRVSMEVRGYISSCLLVFALYVPIKMFNFVNIVGILRSGGDTKAAFLLDTMGVWLIGIPLAIFGGIVLKLPIHWVYAMVMAEEFFKCIFGVRRYLQKKWLCNLIDDKREVQS